MTQPRRPRVLAFLGQKRGSGKTTLAVHVAVAAAEAGEGALVALTVRLTRPQWERIHQLAVSEGVSIQQLAVRGLSHVLNERGLAEL